MKDGRRTAGSSGWATFGSQETGREAGPTNSLSKPPSQVRPIAKNVDRFVGHGTITLSEKIAASWYEIFFTNVQSERARPGSAVPLKAMTS